MQLFSLLHVLIQVYYLILQWSAVWVFESVSSCKKRVGPLSFSSFDWLSRLSITFESGSASHWWALCDRKGFVQRPAVSQTSLTSKGECYSINLQTQNTWASEKVGYTFEDLTLVSFWTTWHCCLLSDQELWFLLSTGNEEKLGAAIGSFTMAFHSLRS